MPFPPFVLLVEASTLIHAQRWHLKQLVPQATDIDTDPVRKRDKD